MIVGEWLWRDCHRICHPGGNAGDCLLKVFCSGAEVPLLLRSAERIKTIMAITCQMSFSGLLIRAAAISRFEMFLLARGDPSGFTASE